MGNFCSKCQVKKKYKEKNKQLAQPNQVESTVKVVTVKGDIHETINTEPNTRDTNITNNGSLPHAQPPPENQRTNQDSPKRHKKRRGRKNNMDTDDSSDTSSSAETSSSDSDNGGYSKSSRKMYKNKGGGTTIVSNKTIVGGNYMAIGKNAKNVVVTINNGRKNEKKPKRSTPTENGMKSSREPVNVFTSYYTTELEKPFGVHETELPSNFIQLQPKKLSVFDMQVLCEWQGSICHIYFPGGVATGFRVGPNKDGPNYIMTAKHVVDRILSGVDTDIIGTEVSQFERLGRGDVYALFDFLRDEHGHTMQNKFYFEERVHFLDEYTDSAVLEIKDNVCGTPIPKPFNFFGLPRLNAQFYLMGHSHGCKKESNIVDHIIDITSPQTATDINNVKQWSQTQYGKDYDPHGTLTSPHRLLFHCTLSKGASGTPGISINSDSRAVVVTMLLCGYPEWYYEQNTDQAAIPRIKCVEQGANMISVGQKMMLSSRELCKEIFGV